MLHVPRKIRALLDASGQPWSLETGSRHFKVRLGGRLIGILPMSKSTQRLYDRSEKNMAARIRRATRKEKADE